MSGTVIQSAEATITWTPISGASELRLRADDLTVTSVEHRGRAVPFRSTPSTLVIELPEGIADQSTVTVRYTPSATALQGNEQVRFGAYHTPRLLPCSFEPGDRARFHVSVAGTDRSAWLALPDSGLASPPHMFGLALGKLPTRTFEGEPALRVMGAVPSATAETLDVETRRMIRFFEERSGVTFPHRTYTQIFLPGKVAQEVHSGAMISLGYLDTWPAKPTEDWLIAHELSHQWWGGAIAASSWGDFWLNEALAVFMTAAWKERRHGRAAYDRERDLAEARYRRQRAAGQDRSLRLGKSATEQDVSDKLAYTKGALALFDARDRMGDESFWKAIRDYSTRGARVGLATTEDLRRALEDRAESRLVGWYRRWVE